MIRPDLPTVLTIGIAGILGYGVLVALVKVKQMISQGSAS